MQSPLMKEALEKYGHPEIVNTDRGSQFAGDRADSTGRRNTLT
jgi:hypothetical protein